MTETIGNGLATLRSAHPVDETVQRILALLQAKGVTVFAVVDHSGEAARAGMQMRPTKLMIFGNPAAGTPVMLASPGSAIDLPLKILVAEDADGVAWMVWNAPEYLQQRHGIPDSVMKPLGAAEALARQVAG